MGPGEACAEALAILLGVPVRAAGIAVCIRAVLLKPLCLLTLAAAALRWVAVARHCSVQKQYTQMGFVIVPRSQPAPHPTRLPW